MPPPPALMEELIEEILLRLPPHYPALLVHAALVCKQWCRLVFSAGFRHRFREFHRTPPMLGFFYSSRNCSSGCKPEFVRTAASCPPIAFPSHCWVLDARHGRVLLLAGPERNSLVIWDPITDDQRGLPFPKRPSQSVFSWTAAVLCAAHGSCKHLDCHSRSFLVVIACTTVSETTFCTYSSDTATWSDPIDTHQQYPGYVQHFRPRALVGNALYFGFYRYKKMLLKYELESHKTSAIDPPPIHWSCDVFIVMVDGGLGCVTQHRSKLHMWSRKDGFGVDAGWTQTRVIDLGILFRSNAILTLPDVVGVADEVGVIFLETRTDIAILTFDLKTYEVKKICGSERFYSIFPYMSFYTPALGAACRGKAPGGSSA